MSAESSTQTNIFRKIKYLAKPFWPLHMRPRKSFWPKTAVENLVTLSLESEGTTFELLNVTSRTKDHLDQWCFCCTLFWKTWRNSIINVKIWGFIWNILERKTANWLYLTLKWQMDQASSIKQKQEFPQTPFSQKAKHQQLLLPKKLCFIVKPFSV